MKRKLPNVTRNLNAEDARIWERTLLAIGGPVLFNALEDVDPLVTVRDDSHIRDDDRLIVETPPERPNKAQRRRLQNIAKAHDLKAQNRDITRSELAYALNVKSIRTVDGYLNTPCNRRICTYCSPSAR